MRKFASYVIIITWTLLIIGLYNLKLDLFILITRLSCRVSEIWSLKYFGVTTLTLTFRDHVTSSVYLSIGLATYGFLYIIHWNHPSILNCIKCIEIIHTEATLFHENYVNRFCKTGTTVSDGRLMVARGRIHYFSSNWFHILSNAMHCIGQTINTHYTRQAFCLLHAILDLTTLSLSLSVVS